MRKVIGAAIGDCITEMGEFAGKSQKDVITFDVNPVGYTPENWNAVVLWNYLYIIRYDFINKSTRDAETIFNELQKKVF